MSNNKHGQSAAEAVVTRGANPSPAGAEQAAAIAAAQTRGMQKPSWLDSGFMGSKRTTNRDVLVEATLLTGTVVVATAAAYATAYALQRIFGEPSNAESALIGGDVVSL